MIICLLLLVLIYISYYFYYTKHWLKNERALPCKYKINSVKEAIIKNRMYYFVDDMINTKNLDPNEIKTEEKPYKIILSCYTGYITTILHSLYTKLSIN